MHKAEPEEGDLASPNRRTSQTIIGLMGTLIVTTEMKKH